jgi:hypothetical protein
LNFVVGVANLFVECASLYAKLSKSEIVLPVSNLHIKAIINLAKNSSSSQQKSLSLLAIFLLQPPTTFKSSEIQLDVIVSELLLECTPITPESLYELELLSMLIANEPRKMDAQLK